MIDNQVYWKFIITPIVVLYFIFGRKYQRYLREEYGYKLLGFPAIIAIAGASIPSILGWIGISGFVVPEEVSMGAVLKTLLFATPGVVLAFITCLAKTRNMLVSIVNIPLLYIISYVASAFVFVAVMAIVAIIVLPAFGKNLATGNSGSSGAYRGTRVCPRCGMEISSNGECGCG